jgi:hypothetical protein
LGLHLGRIDDSAFAGFLFIVGEFLAMRRFIRLTNGFSKNVRYLEAAVNLHFFRYNFMRIHGSLRVTPAMEAGISKHLVSWEDFLSFDLEERKAA